MRLTCIQQRAVNGINFNFEMLTKKKSTIENCRASTAYWQWIWRKTKPTHLQQEKLITMKEKNKKRKVKWRRSTANQHRSYFVCRQSTAIVKTGPQKQWKPPEKNSMNDAGCVEEKHIRQNCRQWKIDSAIEPANGLVDSGAVHDLFMSSAHHEFTFSSRRAVCWSMLFRRSSSTTLSGVRARAR